jgi:hypothetical protein
MNALPTRQTGRADVASHRPSGSVQKLLDTMMQGTTISCRIVFSNGAEYRNSDEAPRFTIVFRRKRGELRLLRYGHVGLLEAYFDGDVDVEGEFALASSIRIRSCACATAGTRCAIPMARLPRPRRTRASTMASARRSTSRGSIASA